MTASTFQRPRGRSLFGDVARLARLAAASRGTGGFARYHDDPSGFAREVLGFEPWEGQDRILSAIARKDSVTVRSGHGIGKSASAAAAGLWFWATRGPGARVILTAPTARQVAEVLWNETRRLYLGARVPLGGDLAQLAATGLRSTDGRQLFGMTAQDAESFAGIRAPEMFVIADESSGISEHIFIALTGNLAGGGRLLLLGNPTKTTGYFFESHRSERFERLHIPSTDSPNVVQKRIVIRGLVSADWVAERAQEWGVDSPLYRQRVLGDFVEAQEGRLFSAEAITEAERRWIDTKGEGRIVVGIDPAGESGDGDESAFAVRQGAKVHRIATRRGLTPSGHVAEAVGILAEFRSFALERPLIVIDRDGVVGARAWSAFCGYKEGHETAFDLVGVRGGERARHQAKDIDRVRDEVWFNLVDRFRNGLAIPGDVKLARELAALRLERHISGRSKVTGKDDLRKELGRSPDRADALSLCAWEPPQTSDEPDAHEGASHADPYRLDGLYGATGERDTTGLVDDPIYGGSRDEVYGR